MRIVRELPWLAAENRPGLKVMGSSSMSVPPCLLKQCLHHTRRFSCYSELSKHTRNRFHEKSLTG